MDLLGFYIAESMPPKVDLKKREQNIEKKDTNKQRYDTHTHTKKTYIKEAVS